MRVNPLALVLFSLMPVALSATPRSARVKIPIGFEPNRGQTADHTARFLAHGFDYELSLSPQSIRLALRGATQPPVVTLTLCGADPQAAPVSAEPQASYSNYLIGRDPDKQQTGIPHFGRAGFQGVYPGIDVLYYGRDGQLEYDFLLHPHADPTRLLMSIAGADAVRLDRRSGALVLSVNGREIRQHQPVAYQTIHGRRVPVASRYQLTADGHGVRIALGAYDQAQALVIDPVISYGTYFGGTGNDSIDAVAADPTTPGVVYVTGGVSTLIGTNPPQIGPSASHAFVAKFNTNLTGAGSLVWITYFGGSGSDGATAIAADATGIYVGGLTQSRDFPVVNAARSTFGGGSLNDGFLAKLNPAGTAFLYATYVGGASTFVLGLAVDANGSLYATGYTGGTSLTTGSPVTLPNQSSAPSTQIVNAYVMRLKGDGSLGFVTYLSGKNGSDGRGIAVDRNRSIYVTGDTTSTDFPVTAGALSGIYNGVAYNGSVYHQVAQPLFMSQSECFITKINQTFDASDNTSTLTYGYSGFLGGVSFDYGNGVAVDAAGSAYVTGTTSSLDFPLTSGAFQSTRGSSASNAFVTKITPAGDSLVYSTLLGSNAAANPTGIVVNTAGQAYVAGSTSGSLPVDRSLQTPLQSTYGGGSSDAFLLRLTADGSAALLLTYLGGSDSDHPGSTGGLALDRNNTAYLGGSTRSANLPAVAAGWKTTFTNDRPAGGTLYEDGFLYAIRDDIGTGTSTTVSPASLTLNASQGSGTAGTQTITLEGAASTTYTAAISTPAGTPAFLTGNPASAANIGTAPNLVLSLDPAVAASLGTGVYHATVTIDTSLGETLTVPVTLNVNAAQSNVALLLTSNLPGPNSGTYLALTLNPNAPVQTRTLTVSSTNAAVALPFQATVSGSVPFVTVSPSSSTTPATVTVTINPAALQLGSPTYTNTIYFTSPNATAAVYTVSVRIPSANAATPAKVGIFRQSPPSGGAGLFLLDTNGDGVCCAGDIAGFLGQAGDLPLAGDWSGSGTRKAGVYRAATGLFLLDVNGNGTYDAGTDKALTFSPAAGDIPVVGDWTGSGVERVGVFREGTWYLDITGDGSFTGRAYLGQAGDIPLTGHWKPTSLASLVGIYRPTAQNGQPGNFFLLDTSGDGQYTGADDAPPFFLGQPGDLPILGDWNRTGTTKVGIVRPANAANGAGLIVLDTDGSLTFNPPVDKVQFFAPYLAGPGTTTSIQAGDIPVVGNWASSYAGPTTTPVDNVSRTGFYRPGTGTFFLDVTNDGTFQGRAYLGQTGDVPLGVPVIGNGAILSVQLGNY